MSRPEKEVPITPNFGEFYSDTRSVKFLLSVMAWRLIDWARGQKSDQSLQAQAEIQAESFEQDQVSGEEFKELASEFAQLQDEFTVFPEYLERRFMPPQLLKVWEWAEIDMFRYLKKDKPLAAYKAWWFSWSRLQADFSQPWRSTELGLNFDHQAQVLEPDFLELLAKIRHHAAEQAGRQGNVFEAQYHYFMAALALIQAQNGRQFAGSFYGPTPKENLEDIQILLEGATCLDEANWLQNRLARFK